MVALSEADIFITEELERRPAGSADYLREKLALQDLARQMAEHPGDVLPRLVSLAMEICEAASAGISLYEPAESGPGIFRWHYLTGVLQKFNGATTPRDFSPCGVCLDERRATLAARPERYYPWIADAKISVPEVLLVPLYSGQSEALGTLWIIAGEGQHFHSGHARVMSELASFAGLAFRMVENERHLTLALNQEQAIAQEMGHRVKNLFAIANGLVSVSARAAKTPQEMATILSGRLAALARAHAIVRKSFGDRHHAIAPSGSLGDLVRAVLEPYDHAAAGHVVAGPELWLDETALNALALVLHELATNAAKYGALKDGHGRVSVTWENAGEGIALAWRETGGPAIAAPPSHKGFGSEIARRSVEQLGGTLNYDWRPEGLEIDIALPLDRLGERSPGLAAS